MKIKLSSNNILQYLITTGICHEQEAKLIKIHPRPSNNFIFLKLDLPSGDWLTVKQEYCYQDNDITNRISRELKLNGFLQNSTDLEFTLSLNLEKLHCDKINSILMYKIPRSYLTLLSVCCKNKKNFSISVSQLVGITLATIHSEAVNSRNCYEFMNRNIEGKSLYQFPYPDYLLDKPTLESLVTELPPEGFEFIALYQRYESLKAAVKELVTNHNQYCLTHNNLQFNNILIHTYWDGLLSQAKPSNKNIIKIINWENCSWGDPAFDLGTVIAGYLLFWLNSLVVHPAINLNQTLELATVPLEVIQPSVIALTKAYISSFPKILDDFPDFFDRVIRFTGLALIYEIIARLKSFKGFSYQYIYILQLAKNLLCKPDKSFESVFGMTKLEFLDLK